jgi:hypothetical protein
VERLSAPDGTEPLLQFNYSTSERSPGGARPGTPRVRGWQFHIGCIPQVPRPQPPGAPPVARYHQSAPSPLAHGEYLVRSRRSHPDAPGARRHGTMRACKLRSRWVQLRSTHPRTTVTSHSPNTYKTVAIPLSSCGFSFHWYFLVPEREFSRARLRGKAP